MKIKDEKRKIARRLQTNKKKKPTNRIQRIFPLNRQNKTNTHNTLSTIAQEERVNRTIFKNRKEEKKKRNLCEKISFNWNQKIQEEYNNNNNVVRKHGLLSKDKQ